MSIARRPEAVWDYTQDCGHRREWWEYAAVHDGTAWSQTNTLVLRDGVVTALLAPVLRWQLRRATRRSMRRAKGILEGT